MNYIVSPERYYYTNQPSRENYDQDNSPYRKLENLQGDTDTVSVIIGKFKNNVRDLALRFLLILNIAEPKITR